jgi:hypothetical protein
MSGLEMTKLSQALAIDGKSDFIKILFHLYEKQLCQASDLNSDGVGEQPLA